MSQNAATLPNSEGNRAERIEITLLKERFPETILEINEFRGDTRITVRREDIVEVCRFLRDDPRLQFNFFSECMGVDYLDNKPHRFEVVYNLYSLRYTRSDGTVVGRNQRIFIKTPVPEDDPVVPSVVEVYPGANWPEREVYDMFGVRFTGHPDLRRILMADDWIGHPQRKDYPLGGERIQFPSNTWGPSVGERIVEHPGESFTGLTANDIGDPS